MIYAPDLARNAVQAALDLPISALNQSVDVCWDSPTFGRDVADSFSRILGRSIIVKPAIPYLLSAVLPVVAFLIPSFRDSYAVLKWVRKGGYISRDPRKQIDLFGVPPTMDEAVARYCEETGVQKLGNHANTQ
jgi:hypothetical protein